MNLQGKVAMITGSTKGIGLGIAEYFAKAGANVVIIGSSSLEVAQKVAKDITGKTGNEALGLQINVGDESAVVAGFKATMDKFGKVDILVNNAGIQTISPFEEFSYDAWRRLLNIHIDGSFLMAKEAIKIMKNLKIRGKIINIGSVHSFVVSPNKAAYCTAKHALVGMTRSLALEGGPFGIGCNLVGPGFVMTDLVRNQIADRARTEKMTEEEVMKSMTANTVDGEFTTVEEVAELTLFLAANKSNVLTGQTIIASHGWVMN